MWCRRWYYTKWHYKPAHPTIAIGNIAWGGTGKTPLLLYVWQVLAKHNITTTIVSRGYKAKPPRYPFVVQRESTPKSVGDEAAMAFAILEESTKRKPQILIDPKRKRAIVYAEQHMQQDCFLLDDAMQHVAVGRDCTIVLLRPIDLLEQWNRVIPAGSWRETKSALKAADIICIKCTDEEWQALLPKIEQKLLPLHVPIYSYSLSVVTLCDVWSHSSCATIPSEYSIVTGIGSPESFSATVCNFMHFPPTSTIVIADHASQEALHSAVARCTTPIICSEKDAIKLQYTKKTATPIYYTKTSLTFGKCIAEHTFDVTLLTYCTR